MILGSITYSLVSIVTNTPTDTFALTRFTIGSGGTPHGVLMPYRASNPLYALFGIYKSPGAVTRTFDATHLTYAFNEDGVTTAMFGGGHGTANLGSTSGLWSLYTASVTWTLTAGYGQTETYGLTIGGVTTNYPLDLMALTFSGLATTFAGPHGVSTQRPFSASGTITTQIHPLVNPQAIADTMAPTADFGVYSGSITAAGVGSISGTIRADSLGSASYAMFPTTSGFQVRFNCGGVYDATASSFDPTIHPMKVAATFSLLPA